MTAVLRLYGPEECEAWEASMGRGPRPLDWKRCRSCRGTGAVPIVGRTMTSCPTCEGHGSLRAAALALLTGPHGIGQRLDGSAVRAAPWTVRCEGCGHPMGEGTWERKAPGPNGEAPNEWVLRTALDYLRNSGIEPRLGYEVGALHWSPCDEGCRHDALTGDVIDTPDQQATINSALDVGRLRLVEARFGRMAPEASWRQVDVRTLKWAFDLSPGNLRVLCARCWAAT